MRICSKVTFGLLCHHGRCNCLVVVGINLCTCAQCLPVLVCRAVNASGLHVAGLHIVQQCLSSTEDNAAGGTLVVEGLHVVIVMLALLDGIACYHAGLIVALDNPLQVNIVDCAGGGVVLDVAVLLGEDADTGIPVLESCADALLLPFRIITGGGVINRKTVLHEE